ncbi:MAG TPA: nucleoside transporter C-terminal domain-containing protein [Thermoanaerobaculales bacterium]|nr:nucleoside transporter C-terminal domain-containing protein [Thermoanaerobaculales bacterium]
MRLIGLLGMLVILALAWAMSYHRTAVRLRTVAWGIGLQVLFAVIVLRQDFWSFAGMGVFGLLLVVFLLQADHARLGRGWGATAVLSAAAIVAGFVLVRWLPAILPALLALLVVALLVNGKLRLAQPAQRYMAALLVVSGIGWLIAGGHYGQQVIAAVSDQVTNFLSLSDYGSKFVFGNLADSRYFFPDSESGWPGFGFQIAFKVLPTIVFFGSFMSVLYYLGIIQRVIGGMAAFMRWTIGTSGAETLSCTANIFVGQTEAPLLIKPFLDDLTKSELLTVMVGGFATIAGGVMAGYIAMGIPAGYLIAASVMGAPAALVMGKIVFPELEHSRTAGDVALPDIKVGDNVIEAASNGILDGFKLALNVAAMLIGFMALIAVVDSMLLFLDRMIDGRLLGGTYVAYAFETLWSPAHGEYQGVFPGSLQTVFGSLLRPLAWLMGVPRADAATVANLIGVKVSLNEFVAYSALSNYIRDGVLSERGMIISTYVLCGFANFSSIGIQIGGISALAPNRRSDLARLGLRAMFAGALASCLTATIAGLLL